MDTRQRLLLAAGFVALSAVVSVVAAPSLPDQLVTNWDAAGEPNGTMATSVALVLLPAVAAGLLGLFVLVPRIDPLRANIAAFRPYYDWFVVLLEAYLLAIHLGIVAFNLGYEFDFTTLVFLAVAVLFYYAGVLLANARRNWFVGIRTPWTLSSETVWDRTHELGSRLFKLSGVLAGAGHRRRHRRLLLLPLRAPRRAPVGRRRRVRAHQPPISPPAAPPGRPPLHSPAR